MIRLLVLLLLAGPALAQTNVYRCGSSYSSRPNTVAATPVPPEEPIYPTAYSYAGTGRPVANDFTTIYSYGFPGGQISSPVPLSIGTTSQFGRMNSITINGTTYRENYRPYLVAPGTVNPYRR